MSCNSYTDAIPRRVYKRRRRNADRHVSLVQNQNTSHDSDFVAPHRPNRKEADISSRQGNTSGAPQRMTLIPSILTFIENHPNLPHILSYYTQFLLNIFIVFLMMHLVYCFWSTIRSDVDLKSREVVSETLAEMAVCNREFEGNRCKRSSRVPAMEKMCDYWEECMKQDPLKVARAGVSANAFAEILNNFFEPITAKTVVCEHARLSIASLLRLVRSTNTCALIDRLFYRNLWLLCHLQHDPYVDSQQDLCISPTTARSIPNAPLRSSLFLFSANVPGTVSYTLSGQYAGDVRAKAGGRDEEIK